jgi:vacuolar-type H+-ATPase subunit H
MNENLIQTLLEKKQEIEDAKIKKANLTGRLEEYQYQLKNEFDCDNIEEASKFLEKITDEIEKESEKLQYDIKNLLGEIEKNEN